MSIDYGLPGLRDTADLDPLGGIDDIGAVVAEDHGPGTAIRLLGVAPMTLGDADHLAGQINTGDDPARHATAVMLVPAPLYRQLVELDRWVHSTYHQTAADLAADGIAEPTVGRGIGRGVVAEFARRYAAGQIPRCGDGQYGGDAA
jgi:hypothetical protein